jgi:aminoglycoside 6'-N-acetyltransferase I
MIKSPIYSELVESDFESCLYMASRLWQDFELDELREDLIKIYNSPNCKTFIAKNQEHLPIGFINVAIRTDYVEGAEHSPTGYLEGILWKKTIEIKASQRTY